MKLLCVGAVASGFTAAPLLLVSVLACCVVQKQQIRRDFVSGSWDYDTFSPHKELP